MDRDIPYVSVVMAAYNAEKCISKAIESILNQTFKAFELILVDDGSCDGTAKLIEYYQGTDKRIRVISHSNMGLTKSLNIGIREAKGRYVARQDADDVSLPERLAKEVTFLDANPNVLLVGANQYEVTPEGRTIGRYYNRSEINRIVYLYNPVAHTSVMFRRKMFMEAGLYDESFFTSQDFEAWMRVAKLGEIAMLEEPLVERSVSYDSVSAKQRYAQCYNSLRARLMHRERGMMAALQASLYQCIATYMPKNIIRLKRNILR